MLPKRRKLLQTKSAVADTSSNLSIASMFARHCSRDNQRMVGQTANLLEVTDRPQTDNRLSLSLQRKRVCTTASVIDLTDDADNNNTADINSTEPCCTVFSSADNIADTATEVQNDYRVEASLLPTDSDSRDLVSTELSTFVSQKRRSNVAVIEGDTRHLSQETSSYESDALICVENSQSDDPSPERPAAADAEIAFRVPYYLENFLLALNSVFSDIFYAELFNDDDLSAWHTFHSLNGNYFLSGHNNFWYIFVCYFQCILIIVECRSFI